VNVLDLPTGVNTSSPQTGAERPLDEVERVPQLFGDWDQRIVVAGEVGGKTMTLARRKKITTLEETMVEAETMAEKKTKVK
jgi:hypothetical protein